MENRPNLTLTGVIIRPDDKEKFLKWANEAYSPLWKRVPGVKGVDLYLPIRERPEYPHLARLNHYEDISVREAVMRSPEWSAIQKDTTITFPSNRYLWNHSYQLVKSFRNDPSFRQDNEDTRIDNAPIMHLEAYQMPPRREKNTMHGLPDGATRCISPS